MSDGHTSRLESALAGRYRPERKLGEGGMASVYLAEDLKHERKVALKILKPELAAVIGAERFLAEIKTTANLQHPHILPLFDSGEADGFLYYVMPYIDGETLRERLDREGQLGVEEAVRIAREVADALDYAHRNGVIHRDIKPANILLHDGRPVVADFGIALAISAAGGGRMTETGLSLGTPHYMSPEQASADRDLSARSDVYSLGCVLYEMLAGQPPHTGPSAQSVLVRILTEDPRPIGDLRRSVPAHVAAAVTKATEKLPADRFESARDFLDALSDVGFAYTAAPRVAARSTMAASGAHAGAGSGWDLRSRLLAGAVVALAGLSLWLGTRSTEAPLAPVVSFVDHEANFFRFPDVGPNGEIAYARRDTVFVRAPGALEATPIHVTAGVLTAGLSFSPDGAWIAFAEREIAGSSPGGRVGPTLGGAALRKVPSAGGPAVTLWQGDGSAFYPRWGDDGNIYFAVRRPSSEGALMRVAEVGGAAASLSDLGETAVITTDVLPDGRGLLVSLGGQQGVFLVDPVSGDTVTLVPDGLGGRWSPTGHLVYEHPSGALWAAQFDLGRRRVTGSAAPVQDGVATLGTFPGVFALSRTGVLVYVEGSARRPGLGLGWEFELVGPDGTTERIPLAPSGHYDARISPDGARLVYTRDDDLWVLDLDLGNHDSVTAGGTAPHNPVWSPDGTRVAYQGADGAVWLRRWDRGDEPVRTMAPSATAETDQWLPDGRVLFSTGGPNQDVFAVKAEAGAQPEPVLRADWAESGASVSPDGRWIAYFTSRGGASHVVVRSWPELADEVRISPEGERLGFSSNLLWASDGRTLFYASMGGTSGVTVQAVRVDTSDGFRVVSIEPTGVEVQGILQDLAPDGRFLVATSAGGRGEEPPVPNRVVVVANWFTELRRRMGR